MPDLDVLTFSEVKQTNPDLYEKADLAASQLVNNGGGRFTVKRDGAENGHVCHLVESCGHVLGDCGCNGYKFNDGPCSHLCALWRASKEGLVEIPRARLVRAAVEVVDVDEERAQTAAEPERRVLSDGGIR